MLNSNQVKILHSQRGNKMLILTDLKRNTYTHSTFKAVFRDELDSIEIHFKKKVSEDVEKFMENECFKYHERLNLWYSVQTPVDRLFIEGLEEKIEVLNSL